MLFSPLPQACPPIPVANIEPTASVIYKQIVWFARGQVNSHLNILKHFSHTSCPPSYVEEGLPFLYFNDGF
jgi:hypothetical protein